MRQPDSVFLGEAYDKVARMLNLQLDPSGGAALEIEGRKGDPERFPFLIPMQKYKNCDFSYSGLKNAVRMVIEKENEQQSMSSQTRSDIAASFQNVAVKHLQEKCIRGMQWAQEHVPQLSDKFVVSGGVAANSFVKSELERASMEFEMQIVCPQPRLCTDNGVMVAWAGMERCVLTQIYLIGIYCFWK